MSFNADKQTQDDLNLLGKYKPGSIYSLFNTVRTRGGEKLLDELFRQPLSDPAAINRRTAVFLYLQEKALVFPFSRESFILIEDYLSEGSAGMLTTLSEILRKRLLEATVKDEAYRILVAEVGAVISFLHTCRDFIDRFDERDAACPLQQEIRSVRSILDDRRLAGLAGMARPVGLAGLHREQEPVSMSWRKLARTHHLLGHVLQKELNALCTILYYLDVYIAVSKVAAERKFSYARALPEDAYTIHATGLRHPCLEKAVGNPVSLDKRRNLLFLTGANMAGKSTFMKSVGIALYLAHMGFPVAADEMEFSVRDGLYSSINVPDNLSLGYSHFYAEVQRVKQIAEEVGKSRSLVIIFDELFKGTNVKDAYDATLAVTAAFAEYRNCCFIISTHIIEVADALRERADNIQFSRLPTLMEGTKPRYTYTLEEGVAADRHGMMIIENEGILDMIGSGGTG